MKNGFQTGIQDSLALTISAIAWYIPANLYPFMTMEYMGNYQAATIYDGVRTLFSEGMWFIGSMVFVASIAVPLLKLIGMLIIVVLAYFDTQFEFIQKCHRVIRNVSKWSMLDVFLLAIMVALFKFGEVVSVNANFGSVAFLMVVILTLFASMRLENGLNWKEENNAKN